MPFLGTTPTQGFVGANPKQSFTANGSTTVFTLTNPVASANDLEVFVGNVRQEPTAAYTAAGTTLTMSEAPDAGLNFYVINKSQAQVTTTPPVNSISTDKIVNDAVTSAKLATDSVSTDALNLASNYTFTGTIAGVKGPAFKAYKTAAQNSVTANASTKVTFETEVYDTDSCYNTSNSRFTPTRAGYYLINVQIEMAHAVDEARLMAMLFKNGAYFAEGTNSSGNDNGVYPSSRAAYLVSMNGSSDYIEGYAYGSNAGGSYNFAYDANYRCTIDGQWVRDL